MAGEKWKKHLNKDSLTWLLQSDSYTVYNTYKYLLDKDETYDEVKEARLKILKDARVTKIVEEIFNWLPIAPGRNNDPKLSYFQLRLLADLGLKKGDKRISEIIKKAESHVVGDFFAARGQAPERPKKGVEFVKPDPEADIWDSAPCNSPVITYALLALGHKSPSLQKSIDALAEKWKTPQGWFCHYYFVNSQYKKLNAGCPIAGLMALDVFSLIPEIKESKIAQNAFEPLNFHWKYGETLYYFGRSTKFWTFKYPFVWYNALYLGDVLTRFEFLKGNKLVQEIINWIESSQDSSGRFKPTSVFLPYKEWDFGNKRESSAWITFLCCRILKRWYD